MSVNHSHNADHGRIQCAPRGTRRAGPVPAVPLPLFLCSKVLPEPPAKTREPLEYRQARADPIPALRGKGETKCGLWICETGSVEIN